MSGTAYRGVQPWPLVALLFGLIFFYLGERLFPASLVTRVILDGIGGVLMIGAVAQRVRERSAARTDLKQALGTVLVFQILAVVAVGLHWVAAQSVVDGLGLTGEGAERFRVVVHVLWTMLLASSVLPLSFLEVSLISTSRAPVLEVKRVRRSADL